MPVYQLDHRLVFPPAHLAAESGLLAVGGDLSPERLVLAYASGIFPWYDEGGPILWHSPDPRMVLRPADITINRSLRKEIRRNRFRITLDRAFETVIAACAVVPRDGQAGTWITAEMKDAYCELHSRGLAHSVEAWLGDELVGGLYGVSLGSAFFGESMFARASNASKVAFSVLCHQLVRWNFSLVDCQVFTDHLARFGASEWPREQFLSALEGALHSPTRLGPWHLDVDTERLPPYTVGRDDT